MKTTSPHTREKKCVGMSCKCKCHYPPYWRGKLIPCTECETPKKETPPSQKKQVKEDCGYALNCLMPNGKYCKKHQPPQECQHGISTFQSCDKCGRNMVNDEPFNKGMEQIGKPPQEEDIMNHTPLDIDKLVTHYVVQKTWSFLLGVLLSLLAVIFLIR